MKKFSLKQTIFSGIALAIPLSIVVYVVYRFFKIFEKAIGPIAKKFGLESILGDLTLTFFSILVMIVIVFFLGLLMRISFIANVRKNIEGWILKFIPSLNHLKLMAAEKLDLENANMNWKPVLYLRCDQYAPAFIVEENNEWITLATTAPPSTEPKGKLIIKRSSISYLEITLKQMNDFNKHFGKGYLSIMQ